MEYQKHPDSEVELALLRLADALCSWERSTGRTSIVVIKEAGGFSRMLDCGKPVDIENLPIGDILEAIK